MRKWLTMMAVVAMAFAFVRCDFGEDEEACDPECDAGFVCDAGECVAEETPDLCADVECADGEKCQAATGDCVADKTGPCTKGESNGYKWVRIDDHADNATLTDCKPNPGADIDAVCVYRDDSEIGCAIDARVQKNADGDPSPAPVCEENTKDDILEALDIPDAYTPWDQPDEPYTGYYSLNGRSIILSFDAGVEFLCGDEVGVFEVQNPDKLETLEKMVISYGVGDDCFDGTACLWSLESDWAVGEDYIDVSWEW